MKREPGFYWVKFKGKWIVAEYFHFKNSNPVWFLTADERDKFDIQFDEINEHRIIAPDEPKHNIKLQDAMVDAFIGHTFTDKEYRDALDFFAGLGYQLPETIPDKFLKFSDNI